MLTHNSPPMFHKQILSIQMDRAEKELSEKFHLGQCGVK